MMLFDSMGAALDWLDAYKQNDLETIVGMHADDAVIECGCGGAKTITGRNGIRAYWTQRLKDYPASGLDDLQNADGEATAISYITRAGVVGAVLEFDQHGKIAFLRCGPKVCS